MKTNMSKVKDFLGKVIYKVVFTLIEMWLAIGMIIYFLPATLFMMCYCRVDFVTAFFNAKQYAINVSKKWFDKDQRLGES